MPIPHRKDIKAQLVEMLLLKGSMTTKNVYVAFSNSWQLSDIEIAQKRAGGAFYQHEIRWARQELANEGIIENPEISGRGIWKLKNGLFNDPEAYDDATISTLTEGASKKVLVNAYERNKKARDKCLEAHGYLCAICNFDFENVYGAIGKRCIHVHHLIEISSIGKEYIIDPIRDMVPVCPNCHYIIHRRKPAFSIKEVKAMLKTGKWSKSNF